MKSKILYLLLLIFLFSCEDLTKEIDYNTIYGGDKLITHGFISKQERVHLIVKKTIAPNDVNADDKVKNAVVFLVQTGDSLIKLNKIDDYQYVSDNDFVVDENANYSLKITADSFDIIASENQSIIKPVKIDSVKLFFDENSNHSNLVVSFYDNKNNNAGYYIKQLYYIAGQIDTTMIDEEFFNPYGLIDNTVKGVNSVEISLGIINKYDSLLVKLYTLSPDLCEFLKSEQKYDASKEDPFYDRPYPVFSNIINGYGIFASYGVDTAIVTITNN